MRTHRHRAGRGSGYGPGMVLSLGVWMLAATATSAAHAAMPEHPPLAAGRAPAEAAVVPDLDLDAGQPTVRVPHSDDLVPTYRPFESDGLEFFGLRDVNNCSTNCFASLEVDCVPTGDYLVTSSFSNVFRANVYRPTSPNKLKEFKMRLNVTSATQNLYFYVYKRRPSDGRYELCFERIAQAGGSGLAWYSSGLISPCLDMDVNGFYLIGIAWQSPSVTFGRDEVLYPAVAAFGVIEGRAGLNVAPPLATEIAQAVNRNGIYATELCFEPRPGACCVGDQCTEAADEFECVDEFLGEYTADGVKCEDISCPLVPQPCCFGTFCTTYNRITCVEKGGQPLDVLGDANNDGVVDLDDYAVFAECLSSNGPAPAEPPTSACLDEFDFAPADGRIDLYDAKVFFDIFDPAGSPIACTGDPCASAVGACCQYNGDCTPGLTVAECNAAGGVRWNQAQDCAAGGCQILGSCCLGEFCVDEIEEAACQGSWCRGRRCAPGLCPLAGGVCPAAGACCLPDGECRNDMLQSECTALTGIYQGHGSTCTPTSCPQPQACCKVDGSCTDVMVTDCTLQFGTSQGPGTECALLTCAADPEACCFANGTCQNATEDECATFSGISQGTGTACAATTGVQACCFVNGTCLDLDAEDCVCAEGTPLGVGSTCATLPLGGCPGACCLNNGSCLSDLARNSCLGHPDERCWLGGRPCSACGDTELCP